MRMPAGAELMSERGKSEALAGLVPATASMASENVSLSES
jgi:hypothetical protein